METHDHDGAVPAPLAREVSRRHVIGRGAALLGAGLAGGALPAAADAPAPPPAGPAVFDVRAYGATGRRADNATGAFRAAVEACAAAGGGTVYVPPGDYTVGTVVLRDHVALHVEAGATLLLSQAEADFVPGTDAMIFAENATNIALTGRGTLDGLARYVFTEMRELDVEIEAEIAIARAAGVDMRRYYRTGMQTFMVVLNDCTDVLLQDVSIVHSPLWTVRLNDCDGVTVRGVYLYSDLEKGVNADGIDIVSSRNVTISDSVIVTADDAVVLKSIPRGDRPAGRVENVVVTNCVLSSSSTALMIGTETHADIRHVVFSNCVIRDANKAFGINVQDGAVVSDVLFSHLTVETRRRHWNWWGSAELCKLVLKRRTPEAPLGAIRDVVVDTVVAHVRGTSTLTGHPERPLENIRMRDVQLTVLPEDVPDKRATDALRVEGVRGFRLRDVSVAWADEAPEPAWRSALVLRDVSDFEVDAFRGRQGRRGSDAPAILLDAVADGTVRDVRATDGCTTFVHVQGGSTRDVVLRDHDTRKATNALTFENESLRAAVAVKP